ncbi:hypothetical protein BaRGS_00020106 [Batillaria attramentaria]|uniref:Uncharacterized protein n=1 Tax=Batillaria attramentaria TaxID=370345 RepID=A0ABD0KP22_9CAEN
MGGMEQDSSTLPLTSFLHPSDSWTTRQARALVAWVHLGLTALKTALYSLSEKCRRPQEAPFTQACLLYRLTAAVNYTLLDLLAVRRAFANNYLSRSPRAPALVGRPLSRIPKLDKRVPRAIRLDGKYHMIQWISKQSDVLSAERRSRQKCKTAKSEEHCQVL